MTRDPVIWSVGISRIYPVPVLIEVVERARWNNLVKFNEKFLLAAISSSSETENARIVNFCFLY
jgi:hypothetical protein